MINYTTGNILESKTQAVVNTVNCEGFMGKGIAYQFKLKYPRNNAEYEKQCRNHQFHIGDILLFEEDNRIILNFPTKDKWRNKSEYDYIRKGLSTLKRRIIENNIKSISIPPLGCGNGGLQWSTVKNLIEFDLNEISENVEILVFEPVHNSSAKFTTTIKKEPKLTSSHLLLMNFKLRLTKFTKIRLQKAAFLNNIISGQDYFLFAGHNFGPYAHSIDILSRDIKAYQTYYNITTAEAFEKAKQTQISKNLISKLESFNNSLNITIEIINKITDDSTLELITSILFLIKAKGFTTSENVVNEIVNWNEHKKLLFSSEKILKAIDYLLNIGLIEKDLYGVLKLKKYYAQHAV